MASLHLSTGGLLELELSLPPGVWTGGVDSGADSGTVGGVRLLEPLRHQPKMHSTLGNGFALRFFFFDCSLCTSVMMSSTGRSAGHEGGADCASIPALKTTTVTAHRTYIR